MSCNRAVTPSTVFYDSDVANDGLASRFNFPSTAAAENGMTRSVTISAPIAIPGAKGSRTRPQRHTNFTPPRSYVGSIEKSMVRSKSAGSLSTAVSFLVAEHVHPRPSHGDVIIGSSDNLKGLSLGFASHFPSKSVPNVERCVLEQGIGHELRVISDSFHLEFSEFRHGYDIVHKSTRVYPSSYPGCSRDHGVASNWQGVVTNIAPGTCHKSGRTTASVHQDSSTMNCELFPHKLD